jgi:hypothetical protein
MDFGATQRALRGHASVSPHVDAFADPNLTREITGTDLRAVAAVLHFALSSDWTSPSTEPNHRYEPLAEVLLRFKDSASALGYEPEFMAAIDTALSQPPIDRPRSVTEMQALFEPKPAELSAPLQVAKHRPNPVRTEPTKKPPPTYLNSTQSVLNLLAQFNPGQEPAEAAEDVEPFKTPVVPTLTEEAEPALPPMRKSLFDAIDAGDDDELPKDGVAFKPVGHPQYADAYVPRSRFSRWQRLMPALKLAGFVLACAGALGWLLTS